MKIQRLALSGLMAVGFVLPACSHVKKPIAVTSAAVIRHQVAEPVEALFTPAQQAILDQGVPTWGRYCRQIVEKCKAQKGVEACIPTRDECASQAVTALKI